MRRDFWVPQPIICEKCHYSTMTVSEYTTCPACAIKLKWTTEKEASGHYYIGRKVSAKEYMEKTKGDY